MGELGLIMAHDSKEAWEVAKQKFPGHAIKEVLLHPCRVLIENKKRYFVYGEKV